MNWIEYGGFSPAGCLPCCEQNIPAGECWLTTPTLLIDGDDTPFANSTVAQNFFDNSGAIIGCVSSFPGDPACDCLIEAQTNHAANTDGFTTWESYNGNILDFFSRPSTTVNGNTEHAQLIKFYAENTSILTINTVVTGGFANYGVGSNVTLYYDNFAAIASNTVANANIDPNTPWSTYQNFDNIATGLYYVLFFTNISPVGDITGGAFAIRYNVETNTGLNICPVRANYLGGYITCQTGI